MNWRRPAIVLLLLAALGTGWLLLSGREAPAPEPGTAAGDRPDYVLEDFELVALDAQGTESFTLRAPVLARDPGTREMEVTTPVFLIPPTGGDGSGWEVRSARGLIGAEGEVLRLRGDVVATSDADGGATLSTESLDMFPEQDRIASSAPVLIEQPGSTTRGVGLEGDLAAARYSLLSEVRIRYVRQ